MPASSAKLAADVEAKLSIERLEHDYRLVREVEEGNRVAFWKVEDGQGRTLEAFKGKEAAEEFLAYQRKAFPDFVIRDADGKAISPRYRSREEELRL